MTRWPPYTSRVVVSVLAVTLLVAAAGFAVHGLVWLAIDYFLLSALLVWQYALVRWTARRSTDRGYRAGYRAARFEFWQSFHEGVLTRGLTPAEWIKAEAERDDPPIVHLVDGEGA